MNVFSEHIWCFSVLSIEGGSRSGVHVGGLQTRSHRNGAGQAETRERQVSEPPKYLPVK